MAACQEYFPKKWTHYFKKDCWDGASTCSGAGNIKMGNIELVCE